ncbi:restriction endonuclease subunit S [Vibrio cyclitrophicus]
MSELPKGWKTVLIDEVTEVISGGTPKSTVPEYYTEEHGDAIAWVTPADLSGYKKQTISHGRRSITNSGYESCSAKLMPKGSVLFSSRAPVGYVVIADNEISTNQGFKSFVPYDGVDSQYLYYYLKSIKHLAESLATGTTFKELSGKVAKTLPFPLAPLAEQKRIVEKLDEVLAQVDTIKARLDGIPALLKRFRQSVLASAVSGKLTEEWREECDEDTSWRQITLKEAAHIQDPHPSHRTPSVVEGGIPFVSIGDLREDGSIDVDNARKVSPEVLKEHKARYALKEGDFIFGKIGTLGKATVLPMGIDFALSANVILIQPEISLAEPKYIQYFLSSPTTMDEVAKQANSTSQAAFGIKKMRAFICRLPTKNEQKEIVRLVDQYFVFADTIKAQVKKAQARVDNLTQSILAKAFRGELVAQDPNDEPADKLLERIAEARKEAEALAKAAKKAEAAKKRAAKIA